MRAEPLRRRLFLLAAAAIVPLAAMAGIALLALTNEQKAQAERAGIDVTRALGTAIDAELNRSVAALQAIAQALALDTGDLKRFNEVMRRLNDDRPDWITVTLADRSGQLLANAAQPFGLNFRGSWTLKACKKPFVPAARRSVLSPKGGAASPPCRCAFPC